MSYEIVALENGDVLDRIEGDFDEAAEALRLYIATHRFRIPGIERQVALLELDDADEPRGRLILYPEILGRRRASVVG